MTSSDQFEDFNLDQIDALPVETGITRCWRQMRTSGESHDGRTYFNISSVSGLSLKLLHGLNRIGQFEIATICGISAFITM